jgi:hypothetical protein
MNKIYIILPIVCMLGFGYYFNVFHTGHVAEQDRKKAAAEAEKAKDDAQKAAEARRAQDETERKQREKQAQIDEEKRKKREEQLRLDNEVRADIERNVAEIASTRKELAEARKKLQDTRLTRERTETLGFKLAREVEETRIARRNFELELQRLAGMMADRIDASALVKEPLFPTPQGGPKK